MNHSTTRPAVFLDRDGVIIANNDSDYIRSVDQIELLPGAREAVAQLARAGYPIVIVTNQAVVAKGFITLETAWRVQHTVESLVKGSHTELYSMLCPHGNNDGCTCRKPKPGMLLQAADRYGINLRRSFMIGDSLSDIAAARAAHVTPVLVLSSRGKSEYHTADKESTQDLVMCDTILEAVQRILQ
jgi:D-glycero-D-manno-heptose 1,7-bisphosphate phosphatase